MDIIELEQRVVEAKAVWMEIGTEYGATRFKLEALSEQLIGAKERYEGLYTALQILRKHSKVVSMVVNPVDSTMGELVK